MHLKWRLHEIIHMLNTQFTIPVTHKSFEIPIDKMLVRRIIVLTTVNLYVQTNGSSVSRSSRNPIDGLINICLQISGPPTFLHLRNVITNKVKETKT